MKLLLQISILFFLSITLLSCQGNKKETPISKPIAKVDSIPKPTISMEDVLNDSIPIWHLSEMEQWERVKRMDKVKYYGDLKLRRSTPLSYSYQSGNGDTLITEVCPGILSYQIKKGELHENRFKYFNEKKEIVNEIDLNLLSPCTKEKYKNLRIGYPYWEDIERIDSTVTNEPNFFVLTISGGYSSFCYGGATYQLFSFYDDSNYGRKYLGTETTLMIFDSKGEVIYKKTKSGYFSGGLSEGGRYLTAHTKNEPLPDEFEIIDIKNDEVIYSEIAMPDQKFSSASIIKTGLLKVSYETEQSHHKIQRYFDLENRIKYEAYLSDEEVVTALTGFTSYWDLLQRISVDTIGY